jgi:alpha-ribazole phosphatase/probable phosphoglycerate mutase
MADFLYLVRHGSVGSARDGRYLGSTDAPLDAVGRRQVEALAELLRAKRRCGRCVCSPLRRAAQTAEILRSAIGRIPEADPDLREIDFGRWEGKTFSEIRDSSPEEVARWAQFAPVFAFPGGESLRDFLGRVGRAADRLAADEAETVLAVTHGGVIKAMLCRLLGLEPRRYVAFEIAPASLTVVRLFEGKGVLSEMIRVEPPEPK